MLKPNIKLTQKSAVVSELHPTLPEIVTLRLRSEAGSTNRGDSLYGDLSISHSVSKELGVGSYRHLVRVNLREQGDIPPAFAYLVIGNQDTVAGEARAQQAVYGLLCALISGGFGDGETQDINVTDADSDGFPTNFVVTYSDPEASNTNVVIDTDAVDGIKTTLRRIVGRES